MKFRLQKVRYIPAALQAGVLYVSNEFAIAAHLCACGCATKIRTPLGPTEWSVAGTGKRPSLSPSVGNWQEACQSHYWIRNGEIRWADHWTLEQISAGRQNQEQRTADYYASRTSSIGHPRGFWIRVRRMFSQLMNFLRALINHGKP